MCVSLSNSNSAGKAALTTRVILLLAGLAAMPACADAPMSAIDWLSESVAKPTAAGYPKPILRPEGEGLPATGPTTGPISVRPLGAVSEDGLGLLSPAKTGLPANLWGPTPAADAVRLIRAERVDTLPSIQSLLYTLLLAELAPPQGTDADGQVFLARVDKLLDLGALDPAMALLDLPERPSVETFRRQFDAALLLGEEDRACTVMRETPEIAPSFPARIFCLARGGDWNAAALSLRTGEALGFIDKPMASLLGQFLDESLAEDAPELPPPVHPTPLELRLYEAIGQPVATVNLPVAFAQSDLRSNSGWRARVEAAERLARNGAIEPNRLFGLYTEQKPAASGGVWDRVAAVGALDAALAAGNADEVAVALPLAWSQMASVELEVPLARFYGPALARMPLTGAAAALAFRMGLLTDDYEKVAAARVAEGGVEPFLIGLARGNVAGTTPPDQLGNAIKAAFDPATPFDPSFEDLLKEGRLGEALLKAIDHVTEGARGDLRDVTSGLQLFRRIGLESVARRASLELLLLERRG
jgi:hypothetical protein